jgi:uncharacterized protein (DUF433 family)
MGELLAFGIESTSRLTGLSVRQLRYWDQTGVFSPQFADEDRSLAHSRVYSFRDLVGLRTLAQLRERVSLQELRKLGAWLKERYETPWASLRFYVAGRKIFFDDPETGARLASSPRGQTALTIEMQPIAREMREAIARLRERQPDEIGRITRRRHVMGNAPVLAGTRIPTSAIWSFHQAGYDTAGIIEQYPRLTEDDIRAAIAHEEQRRQRRAS